MFCLNKRVEEKLLIRLGSFIVKEIVVYIEKEWLGKMGWKE